MQVANPIPTKWAARLIEHMRLSYGTKFTDQWKDIDAEQMVEFWAKQLAGFSGDEIAKGLLACKAMPWPPALPEFMNMCRPPIQPEAAFYEAVTGLNARKRGETGFWSRPAIFFAAVDVGQHDVLNCGWQQIKARWTHALNRQMEKQSWPEIPAPMKALPEPARTELSDEQASQAMEKLGAGNVLKSPRDPKAWAKKILDKSKGRTPTVIAMAKAALENVAA